MSTKSIPKKQADGGTAAAAAAHPARKASTVPSIIEHDNSSVENNPAAIDRSLTKLGRHQSGFNAQADQSPGPSGCSIVLPGIVHKPQQFDSKAAEILERKAADIVERLKQVLPTVDLRITTQRRITNMLAEELGEEVRSYRPLIKVSCCVCLPPIQTIAQICVRTFDTYLRQTLCWHLAMSVSSCHHVLLDWQSLVTL